MILHYIFGPLILALLLFIFPLLPLMIMMKIDKVKNNDIRMDKETFKECYIIPCIKHTSIVILVQILVNFMLLPTIYSYFFGVFIIIVYSYNIAILSLVNRNILKEKFKNWKKNLKYIITAIIAVIILIMGIIDYSHLYKEDELLLGLDKKLPTVTKEEVSSIYSKTASGPYYSNGKLFFYISGEAVIEYNDNQLKTVPINHKIRYMDIRNAYPNYNCTIMDDYVYYNEVLYTKVALTKGIFTGFKFQKYVLINMQTGEFLEYQELPSFAK